jgi:hypothetical protein
MKPCRVPNISTHETFLAGALEPWNFIFPFSWEFDHHPTDEFHHFSEGEGSTTNQPL